VRDVQQDGWARACKKNTHAYVNFVLLVWIHRDLRYVVIVVACTERG
jgi:hypothetical protein